jgi:hypothetical protein
VLPNLAGPGLNVAPQGYGRFSEAGGSTGWAGKNGRNEGTGRATARPVVGRLVRHLTHTRWGTPSKLLHGRCNIQLVGHVSEGREYCPEPGSHLVTTRFGRWHLAAVTQKLSKRGNHKGSHRGTIKCTEAFLARGAEVHLFSCLLHQDAISQCP